MARRRRCQTPKPYLVGGKTWKISYRRDVAQPDGSVAYKLTTKVLGRSPDMSRAQAQREALRLIQPINEVQPQIENAGKTMNDLAKLWCELEAPNLKRSTQTGYEWAFKRILPAFGTWPVSEIEFADIQRFMMDARRRLHGHSQATLLNRLSGLFSLAEDYDWVVRNPIAGRRRRGRLVGPLIPVRLPVEISPQAFQRLVAALPMPYDVVVLVAGLCGLRKGELEALRWRCITERFIVISEALYRRQLGTAKSRKSASPVPLSNQVREALEGWRKVAPFTGDDDFVFALRTPRPINLENVVSRKVKPMCQRLGIPEVSWHDLRRMTATWARQAGLPVEEVRDLLRHESAALTLDRYSQLKADGTSAQRLADHVLGANCVTFSELPLSA